MVLLGIQPWSCIKSVHCTPRHDEMKLKTDPRKNNGRANKEDCRKSLPPKAKHKIYITFERVSDHTTLNDADSAPPSTKFLDLLTRADHIWLNNGTQICYRSAFILMCAKSVKSKAHRKKSTSQETFKSHTCDTSTMRVATTITPAPTTTTTQTNANQTKTNWCQTRNGLLSLMSNEFQHI